MRVMELFSTLPKHEGQSDQRANDPANAGRLPKT